MMLLITMYGNNAGMTEEDHNIRPCLAPSVSTPELNSRNTKTIIKINETIFLNIFIYITGRP